MRVPAIAWTAVFAVAACRKQDDGPQAPTNAAEATVHVQTATAADRPMPRYLTVTGSLRPNEESDVAADAAGKVIAVLVERGQVVARGQIIARLDARSAAFAATAAAAQTKVAQSQLEQARLECGRVKHLLDTGAISRAEFDRQTSACTSQQWSAAAAEAQQDTATKTVGDSSIRAPFDGVVGEHFVNVGQYVQPSTRVASVYSADPLRLELTVPEANVAVVHEGMPVSFSVVAFGDRAFEGRVKYISPAVRESTRDLVVEAIVPNGDGRLKPGMFALAKLLLATPATPVVPTEAVLRDDTGARVFVVAGKQAQERLVQLGETVGDVVAVVSGVSPGDAVVLHPGGDLHDGARVE